jgi:hypothetical protein
MVFDATFNNMALNTITLTPNKEKMNCDFGLQQNIRDIGVPIILCPYEKGFFNAFVSNKFIVV